MTADAPSMDAILRGARSRVVAALVRTAGGLDAAEEAFQEAALAAIEAWPSDGVPDVPAAWLTTAAKNHVRDRARRRAVATAYAPRLREEEAVEIDPFRTVHDDVLRLIVTCCHPALPLASQVALTLKIVLGFEVADVARALMTEESAIAQRIVRAKRTIEEQKLPYELPEPSALAERMVGVLAVVYAVFNEGHVARTGPLARIDRQAEALRLARWLSDARPGDGEVFGLLASIAFGAARAATRADDEGMPILLADQDRTRWDRSLALEGFVALSRARRLAPSGTYVLQAEIAGHHLSAASFEATDFRAILGLYDALLAKTASPVVALNRAVVLARVEGAPAALRALAPLEAALGGQHLFFATRAELTRQAGGDGRADDERALALATNDGERALLRRRLA